MTAVSQDELARLIEGGEGQTVEFKESLSSGAQREGLESLIAFSNAEGGKVFFGVRDDRTVAGVQIGKKTLEDLANRIVQHTYPSLPVYVEPIADGNGRVVLIVEAPRDTPPLVGVYLLSSSPLDPSTPVETAALKSFRRVGRTNQQVNFMHLRKPAPSDAEVILRLDGAGGTAGPHFPREWECYYSNSGSGWALDVSLTAEHRAYEVTASPSGISLPPPAQEDAYFRQYPRKVTMHALGSDEQRNGADQPLWLRATYQDTMGLTWQSTLELIPTRRAVDKQLYDFRQGKFWRRIVVLPAKNELMGGAPS